MAAKTGMGLPKKMSKPIKDKRPFHIIRNGVLYEVIWDTNMYSINVPSLQGCMSVGETIDQALNMITEAMDLYIEVAREKDMYLPEQFMDREITSPPSTKVTRKATKR